ncbi:MAG: hypothetical protein UT39_C0009G0013 [Candidatus Woesebacteria bacterium GW2011_GWA1_39_21]|uniref:Uncharacterized protein n=1 Tax=Candidatus Woesebacteria bacterium GW2011_GWA1_39_21 TaxID=1618550 RepID=A0A0G0N738_9BACT|nr:MAG: hypothetical protein UT39_C0009G0013 [Candidatus Woesebacteria bacterium GW2011_GWA1_39_21]
MKESVIPVLPFVVLLMENVMSRQPAVIWKTEGLVLVSLMTEAAPLIETRVGSTVLLETSVVPNLPNVSVDSQIRRVNVFFLIVQQIRTISGKDQTPLFPILVVHYFNLVAPGRGTIG